MEFIKKNEQKKEETDSMENKEYPFSEETELKACRYCQVMIPKTAKICPNCKKHLKKNWAGIFFLLCLLAAFAAGGYYYMTVYSVTEQVSSAEAVAETGQKNEGSETPEGGLTAENMIETEGTETVEAGQLEDLSELPAVLEGAKTVEAEPDRKADALGKESEAGEEGGLEKETEDDIAGELEKESADKENESERDAEAGKADELEKESADKESELEKESKVDKEGGSGKELQEETTETEEEEITERGESDRDMAETDDHAGMMDDDDLEAALESDMDSVDETMKNADISGYTEEEFRDICSRVDYKKLLRSQELYLNTAVTEELTVLEQVDGGLFDENIYYLCKREDEHGITRYYIVRDDREEDTAPILEGDVLCIYGQLFGSCRLPGYLVKTQPVVPALTMVYYELLEE